MKWLIEILRILRQAGIRVSLSPFYGIRGPAICLVLEGVSWEEIQAVIKPEPVEQLEAI